MLHVIEFHLITIDVRFAKTTKVFIRTPEDAYQEFYNQPSA